MLIIWKAPGNVLNMLMQKREEMQQCSEKSFVPAKELVWGFMSHCPHTTGTASPRQIRWVNSWKYRNYFKNKLPLRISGFWACSCRSQLKKTKPMPVSQHVPPSEFTFAANTRWWERTKVTRVRDLRWTEKKQYFLQLEKDVCSCSKLHSTCFSQGGLSYCIFLEFWYRWTWWKLSRFLSRKRMICPRAIYNVYLCAVCK